MDLTLRFRRSLALRLLQVAGAAALAPALAAGAGCGGNVVVDPVGGGGEGGATGVGGGPATSGPGTTTTNATTSVSTTSVATTATTGTGPNPTSECFAWDNDGPCPIGDEALLLLQQDDCFDTDQYTYQIVGGPYPGDGVCCYDTLTDFCGVGRPLIIEDRPRWAPARDGDGWRSERPRGEGAPRLDGLTAAQREALAEAWARDGLLEHASVASFARFSLDLLAAGAPADLVEAAHGAALDEVRHARLCLALAGAYRGAPIEPGALDLGGQVRVETSLAALAAAATREGCVGETLASLLAAEQLARATDPAVRAALAIIAEDEARHAELAFRAVAWALRAGGEEVRAAVAAALADATRAAPAPGGPAEDPDGALAAHGRLDATTARQVMARGLADVVLPCARALLQA